MKKDLRISTLAIICVLCVAVPGAYGASSVRNLGGSGTYTSVSSATSAGTGGASSVRGGSLRVTPSAGQSGSSTTINTGTTTTGRVATSPRLSIGHYLGGATSVSGGSSLRPQTPGSSSGGSSSGGDVSGGDLAGLRDQIDQLGRDVEDLRAADDSINDALLDKQDTLYPGEDGFIIIDDNTNEIFVDVDALEQELEMIAGKDGREVELGSNDTDLLWRYVGDPEWNILISKAEITGPQGPQGEKGEPGDAANLDAYSTTEQMNQAIGNAIAALADVYATKADVDALEREVAAKANTQYVNDELAKKANAADVYTKAEVYNKTEVDEKVADIVAGDMDEALANKADKTYVDEQLATKADKTELANKADASAVSALETEVGEINDLASDAALAAANAISGLGAKENISNKTQTVTNSATEYPSGAAVTAALADKADKSELANYATNDSVDTKLENYYTISEVDDKVADVVAGDMGEALIGKEDKSNKTQTIDASSTADQYPSAAAVYGALQQKADATTVEQIEQDVTNVSNQYETINETVTNLGDTINNEDTGLKKQVEDAVNTANAAQEAVAGKQDALGFTPEDAANKSQTVVDDETKYPSSAAVYGELETKANVSDLANYATTETVNQIEQNVTSVTEQVTNLGDTINNEDTGLKKQVEDAVNTANAAQQAVAGKQDALTAEQMNAVNSGITADKVSVYDGYADKIDAKQDALGYTAEDVANKTDDMAVDAGSTTKYPTVHAVEAYVANTVAEGVDINTDQIDDGAITEPKLSQDLQDKINGKEDKANLKELAYKDQITNADVADDAAIEKSKLALDVQTALDNAADAVSMSGATPNSVLGADDTGNPVWYEIAM